jgi:YrbI family 3-deoxy-D-manno-octulosonate 8-phosphate phosphatase
MINDAIMQKILPIKLFITDVDGVLTDASMYYTENGDELKKFNTRDGGGLLLLQLAGIKTAIITSEDTKIVERRAKKLNFDFVFQSFKDKVRALEDLLQKNKLENHEVAFIGDDINDLSIMKRVGFSITVADATREIQKIADHILSSKGGEGAVREAAELILDVQGKYETALQLYLKTRSQ